MPKIIEFYKLNKQHKLDSSIPSGAVTLYILRLRKGFFAGSSLRVWARKTEDNQALAGMVEHNKANLREQSL